ncbi:MAG TPA: ankyrin repeat domain-containing protein [Gemmata sp.]
MDGVPLAREIRVAIRQGETEKAVALIGTEQAVREMMTPFGTWLHVAASFGNLGLVKHLVALGADVDCKGGILGGSAINEAASKGHLEVVAYLLDSGAGLDVSEPQYNPLFSAIYGGNLDVVRLLIDKGIDTHVKYTGERMKGMDAYTFAIERGQTQIARFLSERR